ncbi:MAG: DUF1311 domain-containing protein [Roseivirga sp.]|nr:DUF1311 domain-containing protein [Roseivirga sp.]
MKTFLISLISVLLGFTLVAQERHPVDQLAYSKLQKAFSNADMINGENTASEHWDHLLTIVYLEAKKQMQPATFDILRESQRAWLSYRDTEFQMINRLYYAELQGTMWHAPAAAARKRVVRQRVLSLMDQLSLLTMQLEEDPLDIAGKWVGTGADNKSSILEIREDFTLVWSDQSTDKYEVEFYRLSNQCSDAVVQEDEKVISLIMPGKPSDKRCYFLEFTDTLLNLKSMDSKTATLRFKRIN